jgi:formate-dependent nitrite reductase membrane component NrfD
VQRGYYDLPFLKRPWWGWEIALYFFSEGISSGVFILAAMADLVAPGEYRDLVRLSRGISFFTLIPCPPLLIADLGRPERFHHMLRMVKRQSPMSIGAWALTVYSQFVAALFFPFVRRLIPERWVRVAGLPSAFTMLAYPGVLLSTTSIPMWQQTRVLGAVLGMSSFATASSALLLGTALTRSNHRTRVALEWISRSAHIGEAASLAAYHYTAGPMIKPLTRGRYAGMFWSGAVGLGIVMPLMLDLVPGRSKRKTVIGSLLTLAGGLALKWAVVHAGRESAADAEANREAHSKRGR